MIPGRKEMQLLKVVHEKISETRFNHNEYRNKQSADPKNIFFVETSIQPRKFQPSQLCAIESAAKHYPKSTVFVILLFYDQVSLYVHKLTGIK